MLERSEGGVSFDDLLSPIRADRRSSKVVEQIKGAIHRGLLNPGDRLPSERELMTRFEASRMTVRDALRTLEATGLIEIRLGSRGGAFITAPAPARVGAGMADMLALASMTAEEVTEARLVFELALVPLVCERATADDIAALEAICERSREALTAGSYGPELSAEFHAKLAECAHNSAISMVIGSFYAPLLMSLSRARAIAPEMDRVGVEQHAELVQVIAARDMKRAVGLMKEHLMFTAGVLGLRDTLDE
jgi:GntR family transcriptional repressor for pyruvate dehydrogenase complex